MHFKLIILESTTACTNTLLHCSSPRVIRPEFSGRRREAVDLAWNGRIGGTGKWAERVAQSRTDQDPDSPKIRGPSQEAGLGLGREPAIEASAERRMSGGQGLRRSKCTTGRFRRA